MTRIISEDFSGKSDLFRAKVHLLSTFPFTVKMGSRNRCRNQHNFTFRLSLFRSPIRCIARGLTIQKRRTKSSRFERSESLPFEPYEIPPLHLYLSPTPIGFECTLLNRARAFYATCVWIYGRGGGRERRTYVRRSVISVCTKRARGSCTGPRGPVCNYRKSKIEGRKRGGSSAGLCFPQTASYYVI